MGSWQTDLTAHQLSPTPHPRQLGGDLRTSVALGTGSGWVEVQTLSSLAWVPVVMDNDLFFPAVAGLTLLVSFAGVLDDQATAVFVDVAVLDAAEAVVRYLGTNPDSDVDHQLGLMGAIDLGGFDSSSGRGWPISGSIGRTIEAADVIDGYMRLRPYYRTVDDAGTAGSRILLTGATLQAWTLT